MVETKIGPFKYKIIFDKKMLQKIDEQEGDQIISAGRCDHQSQQIIIDPNLHEQSIKETIIHETLHAMFYHGGISQLLCQTLENAGTDLGGEEMEEQIISMLSPLLYGHLQENEMIIEYLADSKTFNEGKTFEEVKGFEWLTMTDLHAQP